MKLTLILSLLAAMITSILAWMPAFSTKTDVAIHASGKYFNRAPSIINPDLATALDVAKWNNNDSAAKVFSVKLKDGKWVIPSHYDYPADDGSRVGETAGNVLNVQKGPLVTDQKSQHAELGVLDPLKPEGLVNEGYGERVTLKDKGGRVLVDMIIGKASGSAGRRYVRDAESDAVYIAELESNISTRFADWVKTDLFDIDTDLIESVTVRDYAINLSQQRIEPRATTDLMRIPDSSSFTAKPIPADKQLAAKTVTQMVNEIGALRLADVRPFIQHRMQECGILTYNPGVLGQAGEEMLVDVMTGQGQVVRQALVGNEGEVVIALRNGLRYHCFFGEPVTVKDDADATDTAAPANTSRYMAVFVQYDQNRDEEFKATVAAAAADTSTAAPTVSPSLERANKEQARFGQFFYVVSEDTFNYLRPSQEQLFEDIPEPEISAELTTPPAGTLEEAAK